MNSYLEIAEKILSRSKTPLTAKEILDAAYRNQLVPPHLFGRTQHKTLQARLSEDVLYNRTKTIFARTGPGRFTLRNNTTVSAAPENAYIAPLRSYQLKRFDVVCAKRQELERLTSFGHNNLLFKNVAKSFRHTFPLLLAEKDENHLPLRIIVAIRHADSLLCLASESDSDSGLKRSLGLFGYLKETDSNLFATDELGLENAVYRIILEQSSMTVTDVDQILRMQSFDSLVFLYINDADQKGSTALVVCACECSDPDIVISSIPSHRSPRWTKALTGINDIDSLDPISRHLISCSEMVKLTVASLIR